MYFDTAMADFWRTLALPYQSTMDALTGDLYVVKAIVEFHGGFKSEVQLRDYAVVAAP